MKKLMIVLLVAIGCQQVFAQASTWKHGSHSYTQKGTLTVDKYDRAATGTVTFTNVPSDYKEFEALYQQFLGKTPHGTAALMVMAMEMYGRNPQEGERCIRLINYPTNVSSVLPRLKDKLQAKADDSYGQRYLPAAVLKGATPQNGYAPSLPYTVEMKASVNKHQELQFSGEGTVVYLYVMGKGWDTEQRSVEIILEPESKLYKVFNCPSLYTGCKRIRGKWAGLK